MFFEKVKNYLCAVKNAKKYDNIVFLGYNCESAYRFYRQYKFVDSSIFGWSYITFEQLKYALDNFSDIGSGNFEYEYDSYMFKDLNTGIYFHGKTPASAFTKDDEQNKKMIEEDKLELKSRLEYLKCKFRNYATNGKPTLYVKKINRADSGEDFVNTRNNILWLLGCLETTCMNDFKLLLITEKDFYHKFLFENEKIITRYVEKYSPDECVTNKKLGDSFGWRAIFTEFQPKNIKKQKGKLKFEVDK